MEHPGNKISEARKLKGITQEELAESAKVNLRTIQRIEGNQNIPRNHTLRLICNALDLDFNHLTYQAKEKNGKIVGEQIANGFFLVIVNFLLMSIFGYLTIDSRANVNSRTGALILSFLIPMFITLFSLKMKPVERMLKFGSGFILYIALMWILHGFPVGFKTGLFICLGIALGILFYGNRVVSGLGLAAPSDK